MRNYCEICLKDVKQKNESSHIKSNSHKEFEKYKHKLLSMKNVDIKDVDGLLYFYMKDHNSKFNHYLLKGQFEIVFNINQDCKYLMTDMINNTTNLSWSNRFREATDILKAEGYYFSHIAEIDIITLAKKRDMTYDFYLKHNMPAIEWKLNAMINKDKTLINHFPQNWWQPVNTKFECSRNNNFQLDFVKEYVFYNQNNENLNIC